ncbi:lamin tail domain-containing protein [Methanothrix harundinacea]|uniref:Nuclease (SNase domain protein) n=1 Tax=Methanothrix harundinacea (strain 6Ac) TaxID=1110509 RepID=G7WM54_METH6|nr:lamin tail domain-containing protein [Methanothrix harundinacea]AET63719.1 hypothetical protein Mhar_0332 [Methanothrix harundinacea 6Ac]
MRITTKFAMIMMLTLAAAIASAAPDEANGTVIAVIAGDVLEVAIDGGDPRTGSGVVTVRVADVALPPNGSEGWEVARTFAESLLKNRTVSLDIDDRTEGGRDPQGRLLAVVYLSDPAGGLNLSHPLNRLLVEAGLAEVCDLEADEFDPRGWWQSGEADAAGGGVRVVINEVEANPPGSDEGGEWVELYNDGFEEAAIGGWTLTAAGGSVVGISPGTVLVGGGFLLVKADGYWLRNDDELVTLRDGAGMEVDRTPALDDGEDDNNSWSRYPDGGEEWAFVQASPAGPVPAVEPSEVTTSDQKEEEKNWLLGSGGCDPYGLWEISEFLQ